MNKQFKFKIFSTNESKQYSIKEIYTNSMQCIVHKLIVNLTISGNISNQSNNSNNSNDNYEVWYKDEGFIFRLCTHPQTTFMYIL